ncbi:SUMF1/EgtB/PvdO family nonheme iron enzyme [Prochlorococcus sp. MIT 0703]|uniref:SUMF1/EgtB/PvdO family nonheme iron enzyme n=1 Tax=unclassified Prochlorococcus TaxID=2627481 RepID=UPI0039A5CAE9
MSSLDNGNEQEDQASINAGQQPFVADGEATNNGNASPANTSAANGEASNLSGNGSQTSVSSSSPDSALSLNPVAAASALTASADAQVAANAANSPYEYYVSNDGDDANLGTIDAPFETIQHAINQVGAGDVVNIRGGIYREELLLEDIHGTAENRITFKGYEGEDVLITGAKEIKTLWEVHEGNIWKTNVDFHVSQLFLDDKMLTPARWPNITKDWDQPDDSNGYSPTQDSFWDLNTQAKLNLESHTSGDLDFEDLGDLHKLSGLDFSLEGAMFIPHFSDQKSEIIQHSAGESTFKIAPTQNSKINQLVKDYRDGDHYYLTAHLDLLDSPREWYYDKEEGELYAWLEDNNNPNDSYIQARDLDKDAEMARTYRREEGKFAVDEDRILEMKNTSFVDFEGITLHSGTFYLNDTDDTTFDDCKFLYSSYHGFMLKSDIEFPGNTATAAPGSPGDNNLVFKNSEFANSYGLSLTTGSNQGTLIENNHFHNSNIYIRGGNGGPVVSGNKYLTGVRNTVNSMGFGGLGRPGKDNLLELNHVYNFHFRADTGGITANQSIQDGLVIRNNWLHGLPSRNGIRFDGDPAGIGGTLQDNVVFNTRRGLRVKGDQHIIIGNTVFDTDRYDINISFDKFYGYETEDSMEYEDRLMGRRGDEPYKGNANSIAHNNAANTLIKIPILDEQDKTANSGRSADRDSGHLEDELRDVYNFDFRPRESSVLVDAGKYLDGYTDEYVGGNPDIGAYEFGDLNYWIPGHQIDKAKTPIPFDSSGTVKTDADLMWLEGIDAIANEIYFGTDPENLVFQKRQKNNIYSPGTLSGGQEYFWRVDTVTDDGIVEGDLWNFTPSEISDVVIDSVHVVDAGNTRDSTKKGDVSYEYYIGKYEVKNAEYTSFLNSAAVSDYHDLYHEGMAEHGGITRTGDSGNYSYSTIAGKENDPVNYVNYFDACRFANWLTTGSTHSGVYNDIKSNSFTRDLSAWGSGGIALANLDEWYKAAYYSGDPTGADGDGYWLYPTQSNTISIDDANYLNPEGGVRPVGSYVDKPSHYGTFDQAGNVNEWIEEKKVQLGGAFDYVEDTYLRNTDSQKDHPGAGGDINTGFRLVSLAPITNGRKTNHAPSWQADAWAGGDAVIGGEYSFSITDSAIDPEGAVLAFSKLEGPEWLSLDAQGKLSGTPSRSDVGINYATFRVADTSGLYHDTPIPVAIKVNGLAEERLYPNIADSWADNNVRTAFSDLELGYNLHLKEGSELEKQAELKQLAVLGDSVSWENTYQLDITAKSLAKDYKLETADITINFDPYLFDEIKASDITIGGQLPIANAVQIDNVEGTIRIAAASLGDLDPGQLYGVEQSDAGASIGAAGAVLASIELNFDEYNLETLTKNSDGSGSIDDLSTPLFFGLSANQDETVFSKALDDESGFANRDIKSLRELGGELAVDGTKVTLYEAEINLVEQGDGLILSSDLDIGSYNASKTNLVRKGDTITATSQWTNVGNIEATDIAITAVTNDNASLSSSSFYISTTEGESYQALTNLESGSFSSTTGAFDSTGQETAQLFADIEITGAAGNVVDLSQGILSLKAEGSEIFENKLGSKNLITYQGDLNYDGRVSMKDLAYLNAGAARQQLASEGQAAADVNKHGLVEASVARGVDANFDGQISMADLAVLDADWGQSLHQGSNGSESSFTGSDQISWEQLDNQGLTGEAAWDNQAFKDQNAVEAGNDFVESLESPAAVGVIDADGDSSRTDNDIAGDYFQDPLSS